MKIFDTMFLDIAHIALPLSIYLLYIAYKKTFNQKETNLVFAITIISMFYIILKYNNPLFAGIPFLIINIPLIISYFKKSNIAIIISTIIIIIYYFNFYNNYLIFLILEYILYYILYLKISKNQVIFISIFSFLKTLITYIELNNYSIIFSILISGVFLYLLALLVIYLLKQTEEILRLHMNLKDINHDKQIKTSLFNITHEIKNPIAVCKGYLDMFDINNKEHAQKYIPIIKEEINRTLLLLEDFLSMNRVKIKKESLDINMLLEDVISNMRLLCKSNNIKIDSQISDDEIYIDGDYNRLMQVLVNIIKNSCEANGVSEIKVWTKLSKDNITINIKDNGEGMNKETLAKIKEPFYTTKPKGSGLGVSLSNEIISAHEGTLNYASKEKEYTLATIILPLEKAY